MRSSGRPSNSLKRNFATMMNDPSNRQQSEAYELDVFKVAMERNTIAQFDTGAGKTTAVMIIKELALSLEKQPSEKKLIVFLAPTRNLVEQQFNVIRENTDLLVDFYHGSKVADGDGKKVDEWDASLWEHEITKNLVMVMTPQLFLDALRNALVDFELICLLIIDECHRATGNHPYANIMKEFYLKSVNKPKIFGMTASLLTKKGISSAGDCEAHITALESILDSQVFMMQNTELENLTPSSPCTYSFYQPNEVDHTELKVKLKSSVLKFEAQLLDMQMSLQRQLKDTNEQHDILRKRLTSDHSNIIYCIDELGPLCAYEAVKYCIANIRKAIEECNFFKESGSKCVSFLEESLSIIANTLPNGHENMLYSGCDYEKMVVAGNITPKIHKLFQLFLSFGGATKLPCIIFVERIITAKVLDMVLRRVADLSHCEVSYLTCKPTSVDAMSAKPQKETHESFRSGKVNLLFATDVAEDEINMPKCSTVIHFDIPKTGCSNSQSWERAHQSGSQFIVMLKRGNAKQREYVRDIIQSEYSMNENAKRRSIGTHVVKSVNLKESETESYHVKPAGDSVTADSSVSVIRNNEDPSEKKMSKDTKEPSSGAGTTKRKELHGTVPIRAASGTWGDKLDDGVDFYAYKISFTCSVIDVKYSSFVLLLESKLDDDVANLEMKLYLVSKFVNCKVSSSAKLHLNAEQITKAKCFQELFFNGIFVKYDGSRQTNQKLWTSSYMYLLLPLESLDPCKINWKQIDSCVSVIEFDKKSSALSGGEQHVDSFMTDSHSTNIIHFANRSVHRDDVKDMVVLAIHSGKIYSVNEVLQDLTAHSPFDGDAKKFASFGDYFKKKYKIDLVHPGQNLLLLKQSHRAHNLLVDFNGEGILHGKKIKADSCKVNTGRERYYARMPPELLAITDVHIDVLKPFYLLPSLMHRLESLMLASQLREQITGNITDLHISSSLILEAITTLRCNESFSMERLELLGDSVLKYAVSCDLYLRYPKYNEGKLSSRRQWQVCNSTLYNLGIGRQLQGYIRDVAFDPTRWTAPGQLPLRPCPCDHGVDTMDVPVDVKYHTEDPKVITGKWCDRGHRWLGSKTISDCVEALVGAYFVDGGLTGALHCMKWLGINCELDPLRVNEAIHIASLHSYTPKLNVLLSLESKISYEFLVKGLLLEAITHASVQGQGVGYCYERLEFLGDSVLDLLITLYLYKKYNNIDPGELTDLRSASVNNENFAYAVVRKNLHPYLQHHSSYLDTQISNYVKFVATSSTDTNSLLTKKSPKALGDLLEGIAGAVLLDTKLNLDEVWSIFELLLTPIVTPEKLELPPFRELIEWCDSKGYFIKDTFTSKGDALIAELRLQLEDSLLTAEGAGTTRKIARGQAALQLLNQLEKKGISRKNQDQDNKNIKESDTARSKITTFNPQPPAATTSIANMKNNCKTEIPVLKSIKTEKGGPRSTLYELCKKMQWPMPVLTPSEQKSKTLIEIGEGVDKRTAFNSFESRISLTIPDYGVIELTGDPRADKKGSFDSAALLMLYELQRLGKLIIG